MRMNQDYDASGYFVGGETFFASSIIAEWPLVVCLQQRYARSVKLLYLQDGRRERCNLVFRSKRKAECNLREKTV